MKDKCFDLKPPLLPINFTLLFTLKAFKHIVLLIFHAPFRLIEIFTTTFREKDTKFHENRATFSKSFHFRERSKMCVSPYNS
jgi:hypothetical protein